MIEFNTTTAIIRYGAVYGVIRHGAVASTSLSKKKTVFELQPITFWQILWMVSFVLVKHCKELNKIKEFKIATQLNNNRNSNRRSFDINKYTKMIKLL